MALSALPEEILPTIFKFLPVDDRKNVRLTSHVWCDACNCLEIVKNEKFLIRFDPKEDDVAEIANRIVSYKKLRPKFEFHDFPVWQLPSNVWVRAKNALESLYFYKCDMRGPTISNIFLNCLELRSFHLESNNELAYSFGSENALDDLIQCKFKQKNLRLLQLYIYARLSSETYQKLFQIFPNIQTFGRGHPYSYNRNPSQLFEFPPMMESFTNNEWSSTSWMEPFCMSTNLKFKKLKTKLHISTYLNNPAVFHSFFSNNTQLEKIKLCIETTGSMYLQLKPLLFNMLDSLPNLKEFKFCPVFCQIRLSALEFHHFLGLISQLETLVLSLLYKKPSRQHFMVDDSNLLELSSPKMKYTKLKKLKLYFYNQKICSAILDRCTSSLQYLYLEDLPVDSSNVLTSKLRDFTELRTLCLHFVWPRSIVFQTCLPALKHFVGRLQNLEHLEIRGLGVWLKNGTELDYLAEFNLPSSLKYFNFEMASNPPPEHLCKLMDIISGKAPNVEIVKLNSYSASSHMVPVSKYLQCLWLERMDLFVSYCRRMKKLRCLILDRHYPLDRYGAGVEHSVEQLFAECHSLKFVRGFSPESGHIVVSYDRYKAQLKWYVNQSIMETLEWLPKFGRPRRNSWAKY